MTRAVWTPLAELELEEILFYIRIQDRHPEAALRIGEQIRDSAERQARGKLPGHEHPAAPDGWLYFRHKRWLIFYQPSAEGIEIMRIVDAVRDLPELFRS